MYKKKSIKDSENIIFKIAFILFVGSLSIVRGINFLEPTDTKETSQAYFDVLDNKLELGEWGIILVIVGVLLVISIMFIGTSADTLLILTMFIAMFVYGFLAVVSRQLLNDWVYSVNYTIMSMLLAVVCFDELRRLLLRSFEVNSLKDIAKLFIDKLKSGGRS